MEDINKNAVEYLKGKEEYHLILLKLKEKYKKTGKLTGKVSFDKLTKEQGMLLGDIDYSLFVNLKGQLSVKRFIDHFCSGRFQGADFLEVLSLYFPEDMKTKKEVRLEKELRKEAFFQALLSEFKEEKTRIWLEAALSFKKYGYGIIYKGYKEDKKYLREKLLMVDKALAMLSFSQEDYMPLPTFASMVTKDSHYFDGDNLGGKLLLSSLSYLKGVDRCYTAEKVSELLFSVGLIKDEVSNFTITSNLIVFDDKEELEGYKWFRRERQPLVITLYNLRSIKRVRGYHNKVFVFENPAVFYQILTAFTIDSPSLICISGQPNLSTLSLLDKISEEDNTIYYAGDFDPEGLQIADNLKYRYGNKLKFLGMDKENYLKIIGNISFAERVGKLEVVTATELQELKEEMKIACRAGYQELLTEFYIEKIREMSIV